jgi:hypothetical protein
MNALWATFRYVLITAVRDRMVAAILAGHVAVLGGAVLMAASALAEGRYTGLAMAGEGMRAVMVLGLITFISFHVRRMEETREIEAILTRPISRPAFVLAYFAAYAGIGALLALSAAPLLAATFSAGGAGLMEWQASLVLECLIVVALALFCALSLGSATASVMAAVGLYALFRLGAFFRAIAENHTGILAHPGADRAATWVVEALAGVLPRLDLFGQGRWLIYGPGGGWGLPELLLQTAVTVTLLLLATIRDLHVKRY